MASPFIALFFSHARLQSQVVCMHNITFLTNMRGGNDAKKTCGALFGHLVQGRKEGGLELMMLERDKILDRETDTYMITANETLTIYEQKLSTIMYLVYRTN